MPSSQRTGARVALAGSERSLRENARDQGPVDPEQQAEVTILLRSRTPNADMERFVQSISSQPVGSRQYLSREQLGELRRAESDDIARIHEFCAAHRLSITNVDAAARMVTVKGKLKDLQQAFGVELRNYQGGGGQTFRARNGPIQLPDEIAAAVDGVFGLDTRPAADTRSA
jgi:kumamolisin